MRHAPEKPNHCARKFLPFPHSSYRSLTCVEPTCIPLQHAHDTYVWRHHPRKEPAFALSSSVYPCYIVRSPQFGLPQVCVNIPSGCYTCMQWHMKHNADSRLRVMCNFNAVDKKEPHMSSVDVLPPALPRYTVLMLRRFRDRA